MAVRIRKYRKRPSRRMRRIRRSTKRLTQGKIYSFKRTCQMLPHYWDGSAWAQYAFNEISPSITYPSLSGIIKFRLEDLPGATDFTQLYEQFKITGVKLKFIPMMGTENGQTTGTFTETMAVCIDRGANDLAVVNPSFNSLLENQDVKLRNTQRPFNLWVGTPTFHQPADGLTQGSYKSGWLDSEVVASRNVDYHGVKWAFPVNRTAANSPVFRVFATYYIKCRNPQ